MTDHRPAGIAKWLGEAEPTLAYLDHGIRRCVLRLVQIGAGVHRYPHQRAVVHSEEGREVDHRIRARAIGPRCRDRGVVADHPDPSPPAYTNPTQLPTH